MIVSDVSIEHQLDVDDLCRDLERSKLYCTQTNTNELLEALNVTRQLLADLHSGLRSEKDVRITEHLMLRGKAYADYLHHITFSSSGSFIQHALLRFQASLLQLPAGTTEHLLFLTYYIDTEICIWANIID